MLGGNGFHSLESLAPHSAYALNSQLSNISGSLDAQRADGLRRLQAQSALYAESIDSRYADLLRTVDAARGQGYEAID